MKFTKKLVLPTIVLSQFFCTSLWFAGNAVLTGLAAEKGLKGSLVADMTSAVQLGFIMGTLVFAGLAIADRFSPSKVFFISAVLAAICNLGVMLPFSGIMPLYASRLFAGFFLAGVYPVGMKIASDHYQQGLGKSLGLLVGALVLGKAFPHLLRFIGHELSWRFVFYATSAIAITGALFLLLLVPDGPHRKSPPKLRWQGFLQGFRIPAFRKAAFGYFGHMWEVYTFWAFVPVMIQYVFGRQETSSLHVSWWSFCIIGIGALSCAANGFLSKRFGARNLAIIALAGSSICCLLSPYFLQQHSHFLLLCFLLLWGVFVIADSPMLSTLVASAAPAEVRGSSLTIVNCIGFSLTIVSMQCLDWFSSRIPFPYLFLLLAPGPVLGLLGLRRQ